MRIWHILPLLFPLIACGDDEPGPREYPGPVAPCEVDSALAVDQALNPWPAEGAYQLPGPFPVWNTAPNPECRQNPTISDGEFKDKELYVTFPTATTATQTGSSQFADGKFPVIVFAHANNDSVCNIFEKYFSLHDHWASYGFVVVAVDGTDTNCQPGNTENLRLRSDSQVAAWEELKKLNDDPASIFYQHIDTDKVIYAGHSRGGGAALLSAKKTPEVKGVIDLQGVDLTAFGYGANVLPEFPVIGITAGNDVDLDYPHCEPTEDMLGGDYTWVNLVGGIHAYTADTVPLEPDDGPDISRAEQHDATEYFTTAFLHHAVGLSGDWSTNLAKAALFSHAGAAYVLENEVTSKGAFTRWRTNADRIDIDNFDGLDPTTNLLGQPASGSNSHEAATYRPDTNPTTGMYGKSWSLQLDDGAIYATSLTVDGVPTSVPAGWALETRIKGPDKGAVGALQIAVETESATLMFDAAEFIGPMSLSNRFQQVRIPLNGAEQAKSVTLSVSGGTLFVDDLRFAEQ